MLAKIEKLKRCFLWKGSSDKRKIHWVGWDTVCLSKRKGGLGLGTISVMNKALLAKWIWRYGNGPDTLWKRVLKAKYDLESLILFRLANNT